LYKGGIYISKAILSSFYMHVKPVSPLAIIPPALIIVYSRYILYFWAYFHIYTS